MFDQIDSFVGKPYTEFSAEMRRLKLIYGGETVGSLGKRITFWNCDETHPVRCTVTIDPLRDLLKAVCLSVEADG